MDQFLAEYYGTAEEAGGAYADDDIEKMAQLTLLTKEAAAEGIDLSQFSDDELLEMADDIYGGEGYVDQEADLEKEAQAKFEEADFLGRVMAHSFNQEQWEIEKEAGRIEQAGKALEAIPGKLRGYAGTAKERVVAAGSKALERAKAAPESLGQRMITKKERMSLRTRMSPGDAMRETERMARRRGTAALAGGAAALTAGGVGTGAYLAGRKSREKKSADSAFEQLVLQRAEEHLGAAGLIEKEAGEEDFDTMVDRAALELLEANGYPVEWY